MHPRVATVNCLVPGEAFLTSLMGSAIFLRPRGTLFSPQHVHVYISLCLFGNSLLLLSVRWGITSLHLVNKGKQFLNANHRSRHPEQFLQALSHLIRTVTLTVRFLTDPVQLLRKWRHLGICPSSHGS